MLIVSALKNHPLLPATLLAGGMFAAILTLLLGAHSPAVWLLWLGGIGAVGTFFIGRFFICGLCLGVLAVGFNAPTPYPDSFSNCQFKAQITRPNYSKRYLGQEVRLAADHIVCNGAKLPAQTVQYWDNSRELSDFIGKRLTLSAQLAPIHSRLNPDSFDYEKYLLASGIRLSVKKLRILSTKPENNWLLRVKNHVSDNIRQHLSSQNAGIVLALLTGNRTALSPEQKQTMQATGTSHLLAISGLHLALVGGVCWLIFQWLWALSWRLSDWISPRHAGAIAALATITFYAVFTGFDVPVKRAWVMFSLLILSWLMGRGLANSSLLLAACAVMFVSPYAVVSVGFYFSFIATFIVLWSARLPYSPLVQVLIMQVLINLTLLPITWGEFGVVSLSALLVNLIVIPWLGLWVLPVAILASIVSVISATLATPIWYLLDVTTRMLWQTITFAERLNLTFYPTTRPDLAVIIAVVACVIIALISGRKWLFAGVLLLFLPTLSQPPAEFIMADRKYTTALIHNGKTAIIINAGRRYRHINDAQLWQRYLHQHGLQLGAIVLENDKLTRISATHWLLAQFPTARVITLEKFPLPYPADYCQSLDFANLRLESRQTAKGCRADIYWQGERIALFPDDEQSDGEHTNALKPKATLIWQGKSYSPTALGAITIQAENEHFTLSNLRQKDRLWR